MKKILYINTDLVKFKQIKNLLNSSSTLLQLWPIVDINSVKEFKILKSNDFVTNKDHQLVSDFVLDISKNWWRYFGLNNYTEELNIHGLKISQNLSSEIELELSKILFNIISINNVLEKYKFKKIKFICSQEKYQTVLYDIYKNKIDCELIFIKNNKKSNYFNFNKFINKLSNYYNYRYSFFSKINYFKSSQNKIVISNGYRCLKKFIRNKNIIKDFYFIDNKEFEFKINPSPFVLNSMNINSKKITFLELDLFPYFKIRLEEIENNFLSPIIFVVDVLDFCKKK